MAAVKLVLVHGRAQEGRSSAEIKEEWTTALRTGLGPERSTVLDEVDIVVPFYGDALAAFAQQAEEDLPPDIVVRGPAPDREDPADPAYRRFQLEYATEVQAHLRLTDADVKRSINTDVVERGPLNWPWVQAILRAADVIPGISASALDSFTRDVFLYLSRTKVKKAINAIVDEVIPEAPSIVVAHSLGSVVAYNVLRSPGHAISVPTYITLGCPLGIGPILRQIQAPIQFPPTCKAWFNALDTRDVVALYPLDQQRFPVQPAVENYDKVRNETENRHGITGYLGDKTVAERIYDSIRRIQKC